MDARKYHPLAAAGDADVRKFIFARNILIFLSKKRKRTASARANALQQCWMEKDETCSTLKLCEKVLKKHNFVFSIVDMSIFSKGCFEIVCLRLA